jgi:hypothetical protein
MEVRVRAWLPDTPGALQGLIEALRGLGGDVVDIEVRDGKDLGHTCTRCDHPAANHGWEFSPGFIDVECHADGCGCGYRSEVRGVNT